jgi:hypothetical protein
MTVASEWVGEMEQKIADLEELCKRQATIISALIPHVKEHFYVAGALGEKDRNGLPDAIEICPAYGCGWTMIYTKTGRVVSAEGG